MTGFFRRDDMDQLMIADMDVPLTYHQLVHRGRHGVIRMTQLRRWQVIQMCRQRSPENHTDMIATQLLGRNSTRICLTTRLVLVEKPTSLYHTKSTLIYPIYRASTSDTMDPRPSLVHRNVEADQAVLSGRVRRVTGAVVVVVVVVRQAGREILVRIVMEGNFRIRD